MSFDPDRHRLPERIAAERLGIRTWRPQDGPAMEQLIASSLDHLRPWMAWARHEPITIEQRRRMFTRWESYRASGSGAVYAVFHRRELIGGCALHRRVGRRSLDVGYWLGANATGKGHATAIVGALIETAVSLEDIDFLQISHDAANTASGAVADRLGFTAIAALDGLTSRTWQLDTSLNC